MSVAGAPSPVPADRSINDGGSAGRLKRFVLATLCGFPLLLVYGILWREATDLPIADDYHAIFVFALDQRRLPALGRFLAVVTAQHNEYKLIFEHAIVAADLVFSGHVHLSFLVWLGNLLLLPLGFVFWLQFRPRDPIENRLLWFIPLCWLLYQLSYAEMLDWAMEGLQALAVVCFSVAALYLLTRSSRRSFVLACVTGVAAALSSVNGFLVAPIGLVMLLGQRRLPRLVPWIVVFAGGLGAYLYGYTRIDHGGVPAPFFVRLVFIPSLLGGAVENMHGFPVRHAAVALGLGMLVVYVHALRSGYYRAQPFIFATATWALLTAVITGWVRSSLGLDLSLSSRYKIYSALMLVFCYQYLVDRVLASENLSVQTRRVLYAGALGAAVLFALGSDAAGLKLLKTRRTEAIAGLGWYLAAPQIHSPFPEHLVAQSAANDSTAVGNEARTSMTEVLATGVYTLPQKEVAEACANTACARGTGR